MSKMLLKIILAYYREQINMALDHSARMKEFLLDNKKGKKI